MDEKRTCLKIERLFRSFTEGVIVRMYIPYTMYPDKRPPLLCELKSLALELVTYRGSFWKWVMQSLTRCGKIVLDQHVVLLHDDSLERETGLLSVQGCRRLIYFHWSVPFLLCDTDHIPAFVAWLTQLVICDRCVSLHRLQRIAKCWKEGVCIVFHSHKCLVLNKVKRSVYF